MAMIEKIRNQQTLLMVVLGIGMLGFLVPFDAVQALLGQGASREVGSVNGVGVTGQEYQIAVQNRRSLGFTGETLAEEVWNDMVSEIVMENEYSNIGMQVSDLEFQEMLFGDIDSGYMSRAFYSNGDNKKTWVANFQSMLTTPEGKARLMRYKDVIVNKRKNEKFDALVNVGAYANTLEGKYDYLAANNKVEFKYVVKLFRNIADSEVEVSDRDIQAYYAEHKSDKEFQQKEGRDLTIIKIPVGASDTDVESINVELATIKESWENISDKRAFAEADDNGVVRTLRKAQVETSVDESKFFEVSKGTTVGPYIKGDKSIVATVLDRKMVPDTAAKVRHILLQAKDINDASEMTKINAKADSLKRLLRNGADFTELAAQHSDDPGSKNNGGVYDFFPQGQMVPEFNDFSFNKRVGSLGSVTTTYGVHIIEVLDRRYKVEEAEVAMISRDLGASDETRRAAYAAANDFAIEYSNKDEIVTAAEAEGYTTNVSLGVARTAKSVTGIRNGSEVVSWAFNAEQGEISHPILADDHYVIAILDLVKEEGEPSFEAVEEKMRAGAIKEAKAELYKELMNGNNLEEISEAVDSPVRTAMNANLKNANISGSGAAAEPKVVGMAFSIPEGNMSNPIVGNHGVWVIAPQKTTEAAEKTDYFEEQTTLATRARSGLSLSITNGMKEASEIIDSRN